MIDVGDSQSFSTPCSLAVIGLKPRELHFGTP